MKKDQTILNANFQPLFHAGNRRRYKIIIEKIRRRSGRSDEINKLLDLLQSDPESPELLAFIQQLRMEMKENEEREMLTGKGSGTISCNKRR